MPGQNQNASFIPKQKVTSVESKRPGKRVYILSYISSIVFFGTVLVVLGVVVFELQLQRQKDALITELVAEEGQYDAQTILNIVQRERKLLVAEHLFSTHAAPSRIFAELESLVVDSVVFDSLSFTREADQLTFELAAQTDNFDATIQQRDIFAQSDLLAGVALTEISFGVAADPENAENAENAGVSSSLISFQLTTTASASDIPFTGTVSEFEVSDTPPNATLLDSNEGFNNGTTTAEELVDDDIESE